MTNNCRHMSVFIMIAMVPNTMPAYKVGTEQLISKHITYSNSNISARKNTKLLVYAKTWINLKLLMMSADNFLCIFSMFLHGLITLSPGDSLRTCLKSQRQYLPKDWISRDGQVNSVSWYSYRDICLHSRVVALVSPFLGEDCLQRRANIFFSWQENDRCASALYEFQVSSF